MTLAPMLCFFELHDSFLQRLLRLHMSRCRTSFPAKATLTTLQVLESRTKEQFELCSGSPWPDMATEKLEYTPAPHPDPSLALQCLILQSRGVKCCIVLFQCQLVVGPARASMRYPDCPTSPLTKVGHSRTEAPSSFVNRSGESQNMRLVCSNSDLLRSIWATAT